MADMTLKLTVPQNVAAKAKVVQEGGEYRGTEWSFTALDENGESMMLAAISTMIGDWSRERRENDPAFAVAVAEVRKRLLALG